LTCCDAQLTRQGYGGQGARSDEQFPQVSATQESEKSQGCYRLLTAENGHNTCDLDHAHLFESNYLTCQ
jgi:hypothetical protein